MFQNNSRAGVVNVSSRVIFVCSYDVDTVIESYFDDNTVEMLCFVSRWLLPEGSQESPGLQVMPRLQIIHRENFMQTLLRALIVCTGGELAGLYKRLPGLTGYFFDRRLFWPAVGRKITEEQIENIHFCFPWSAVP